MAAAEPTGSSGEPALAARLLGPFSVSAGGRSAGPWQRPSARRLCELVLVSPDRRISRDLACEELFGALGQHAAARSLSKALSMARAALSALGEPGTSLLAADLTQIWAAAPVQVDAEDQLAALRAALRMEPGADRDDALVAALADERELLADEPYADWAIRPREHLEALRQEARLTLARDRSAGAGRSDPQAVAEAWLSCFSHDPAGEEAAGAVLRGYLAQGRRELAARAYERCAAALEELGLRTSPSLDELYAAAVSRAAALPVPAAAAGAAVAPPSAAGTAVTAAAGTAATLREELRTITVLFAEVAAPAGLAGRLDPESLRELVGSSLTAVITEVEALGGMVSSVSGRGLQAMFGAPQAHEDDPERAVRAAYRALNSVATHDGAAPVLRIGVETGAAVVGPIGGGGKVEYGALGDVVGAAATLQSLARPGTALVGPATYAAIGHLFTWGPREEVPADQDGKPLLACYLGEPRTRGSQLRLSGRGPLVGRRAEMAVLTAALRDAVQGQGSVVLLTGEPGLGKSRLVQECRKRFMAWVGARSGRLPLWLEGRAASYTSATPYSLYQQLLASWIGAGPDQPTAVVSAALERALTALMANTELLPLLARVMGLPPGATADMTNPEEVQRAAFGALRTVISRLVPARRPGVIVLEDLHWADPTSLRFTAELAALTAGRSLLVLATARPDAGPDVAALERSAAVRRVELRPLAADAERELATSLIGEPAVGQEVLDTVLSSVDGNPLYLEERLSSLLETGALAQRQGSWRLRGTPGPAVPQVLDRLVRSRIDRLSLAAQEAVRPASVLGTQFPVSLLAAVCQPGAPLRQALDELSAKDLMHQVPGAPEPTFRFRHPLIQEAVYSGLLRGERRRLHGRAAVALETACAHCLDEVAAVLGRHFAAAGEAARALRYLEVAGDRATGAFANDEAISSYREGLAETAHLAATADPADVADATVRLHAKLANVLWRTARRGAARDAFRRAIDATDELPDKGGALLRAHLLTRLGRLELADLRLDAAAGAFRAAEALLGTRPGETGQEIDQWLELMVDGWSSLYIHRSEPERAMAKLEAVRSMVVERGTPARRYSFYMYLAFQRMMNRRMRADEEAIADMRRSLAAAEQGDDTKDIGYATYFVGWILWHHGDLAEGRDYLERALALSERVGETLLRSNSLGGLVLTALRCHDVEAVRALLPRSVAAARAVGRPETLAWAMAPGAWLAWHDGQPDEVIRLADEASSARTRLVSTGARYRWVYLWPLVAAQLAKGDTGAAVAAAGQLLDPGQQALPDELASALEAACRTWDRGDQDATRDCLADALALARDLSYF